MGWEAPPSGRAGRGPPAARAARRAAGRRAFHCWRAAGSPPRMAGGPAASAAQGPLCGLSFQQPGRGAEGLHLQAGLFDFLHQKARGLPAHVEHVHLHGGEAGDEQLGKGIAVKGHQRQVPWNAQPQLHGALQALQGDVVAKRIYAKMGEIIGIGLTSVINLLNPERVIIGGGVADAGDILFEPIKDTIARRAMPIQAASVEIVKAQLGNTAGVIGASLLIES